MLHGREDRTFARDRTQVHGQSNIVTAAIALIHVVSAVREPVAQIDVDGLDRHGYTT